MSTENKEAMMNSSEYLPQNFISTSKQISKGTVLYIYNRTEDSKVASETQNPTVVLMKKLVDTSLQERLPLMREMTDRLNVRGSQDLHLLYSVATSLFDDEKVTWGRIVTLHAFCAYQARHLKDMSDVHLQNEISDILCDIIVNRLGLWIVCNGGWDDFRHKLDGLHSNYSYETCGVWKGLIVVAIFITIVLVAYSSVVFINNN